MTSEPLPDTWVSRELPILRVALRRLDAGEQNVPMKEIGEETGIPPRQLSAGLEALLNAEPPYIEVDAAAGWSDDRYGGGWVTMVYERGRRELGTWPSADLILEQLLVALEKAGRDAPEDEKGKIRTTLEYLRDAGRDVAIGALAARLGG